MSFKKLSNLKSVLNNSKIQNDNNALYQVISGILDALIKYDDEPIALNNPDRGQISFPFPFNFSDDLHTISSFEKGLWNPIDTSGAGLAFTILKQGRYIKLDELVVAHGSFTYPATGNGANSSIGGLPYICGLHNGSAICHFTDLGVMPLLPIAQSTKNINPYVLTTGVQYTNAGLSAKILAFTAIYIAAQ